MIYASDVLRLLLPTRESLPTVVRVVTKEAIPDLEDDDDDGHDGMCGTSSDLST